MPQLLLATRSTLQLGAVYGACARRRLHQESAAATGTLAGTQRRRH